MYPRYDTYPGLHRALTSLEELNDTLRQRHNAGYNGGERLFEWVILGRFYLDSCGNAMKYVGDHIPAVMFPGIPEVLDRQAFFEYVQRNLPGQECPSFTASMGDDIPPANLICPECGARWTVKDCHDTVVSHETRVVSLKDFVGRPLSAAKKLWAKSEHTVWRIQPEKSVRNDIYTTTPSSIRISDGNINGKSTSVVGSKPVTTTSFCPTMKPWSISGPTVTLPATGNSSHPQNTHTSRRSLRMPASTGSL